MMRVIRARDAIQQINLMAAAFGSMEERALSEFNRGLQTEATLSEVVSGARRPGSVDELRALMGDGPRQQIVIEG